MDHSTLIDRLTDNSPEALASLWEQADRVRRANVGDEVHLRGLVEISSFCRRSCTYCGLRAENAGLTRYRMTDAEIVEATALAESLGYGSVVLQAGEDPGLTVQGLARVVREIKATTRLAVTLSLGERPLGELEQLRAAGADRYLLRFETSNLTLLDRIHPPLPGAPARMTLLRSLRGLGFEVGSGVMVGLPGTTWSDLARDLMLFQELDLDMIGVGPYIPHPATPLGRASTGALLEPRPPADELTTLKVVALTRLLCPQSNIPATTALATINPLEGRELALRRGANVCMPNVTPTKYRRHYEIYPDKACMDEAATQCDGCLRGRIARIGRPVGVGPGPSPRFAGGLPAEPHSAARAPLLPVVR